MKTNYLQEDFINEFNQTIRPGDSIIAVSSGYAHSVNVREAIYLGLRRSSSGKISGVVIQATIKIWGWKDSDGSFSKGWRAQLKNPKRAMIEVTSRRTLPSKRIYLTIPKAGQLV